MKKRRRNRKRINKNKILKRKIKHTIEIVLAIILIITTILFISLLYMLNIIPSKYFILGSIILSIITLLITFCLLIKKNSKVIYSFKIICYIFSLLLIATYTFGTYYLNKTMNFLDNISLVKEEKTNYYIMVLKDSKYQEISDLYGQTLAYIDKTDEEVIKHIRLELKYSKFQTINELKEKLLNKEVEAILISDIEKHNLDEEKAEEGKTKFNDNIKIIKTISIKNEIEDITKKVSIKNTPFNILISGIDAYGDINEISRNDVNIIATINPNTNEILLTSIPRDYYVQLHGTTGNKDKLTHASYYGINTQIKTIEDIFSIDINYYIKVNFTTVIDLVDAIGGIEIYADQSVYMAKNCKIIKGYNKVDGACALRFSRERYSYVDGDNHRARNQQEVIKGIFNKISNGSTLLTEYTNILQVLDGKFATNMDMNEVLNLIKYEVSDLSNYYIATAQVDGYGDIGETYSYPNQDLWIMIPNQKSIETAKNKINTILNNKSIKKS